LKAHLLLIQKYLSNQCDESDLKSFYDLFENNLDFKEKYFSAKDQQDFDFMKNNKHSFDVDTEWKTLNIKIKSIPKKGRKRILSIGWIRVAAIVLISFGLGTSIHLFTQIETKNKLGHTISVPRGQLSKLTLNDGTVVWINSHSKITLPADYSAENRSLKMTGEAYFEIKKNPLSPFKIQTNGLKINVLGTSFNVRSYLEEKKIITTLEEGKVEILTKENNTIQLLPGQQAIYDKVVKTILQKKVKTKYFTSWKNGELYLDKMSFKNLIYMLEIWFEYDFKFNHSDFINTHFTGVLKKEKDIEQILEMIDHVTPINYTIDTTKNIIIITPKKQ